MNPVVRFKKQLINVRIRWNESKRLRKKLSERAKQNHTIAPSTLYLFLDGYMAHFECGADIEEYTLLFLHEKKRYVRRNTLTYKRFNDDLYQRWNPVEVREIFIKKVTFLKEFAQFVDREWIYPAEATEDDFLAFAHRHDVIFAKPGDGSFGIGAEKIDTTGKSDDELRALYSDLRSKDMLVEQCVERHPDMIFGNKSVNTVRVVTLLDRQGKPHIIAAYLRAGVGDSVVDNGYSGGVSYNVDAKLGVITEPGMLVGGEKDIIVHPQTDIVMVGRQIPHWDKVIDIVTRAAKVHPACRYVGWDVAIRPDGIEFIEGNNRANIEIYEGFSRTGYYSLLKSLT